ncbi:MAG: triple tyrosine motif-containing protein, partial [Spirochaetaceae bacterium]|nr:triple tyrosine motif-containing protein [Spirochaetaceae bacterium]
TLSGLALYDRDRDGFYAPLLEGEDAARLASAEVWRFIEEKDGRLMIATSSGLLRYDPSTGRAERWANDPAAPESLIEDHIIELQENGDGRYWVGTWYSGLDLFDPKTGRAEHITTRDGMPDNSIMAVIPDGQGSCWVSTNFGLARVEEGGGKVRAFFKERDGLPSTSFNGTSSCCRASDGTLLFGTDGLMWFSPGEIAGEPIAAPARILALRSLDGKISLPSAYVFESVDIPWSSNGLSIEFGALDYATGAGTQYQYRLQGHDDQWISSGLNRIAHYSDLPGGSFVFEVRATDSEGDWSPEATWASLGLSVGTHPLKSWWAVAIYVLAFALAVFAAFSSLRRRQELRLAAAKAEATRERAHAERLSRLDQLKDAFLANTSHELRT